MRDQPIPNVDLEDVKRVVRRNLAPDDVESVLSMLDEYDPVSGPPAARIKLAILKLANGDRDLLRAPLEHAKTDYRDVIALAGEPRYGREVLGQGEPPNELESMIQDDWEQYESWLSH